VGGGQGGGRGGGLQGFGGGGGSMSGGCRGRLCATAIQVVVVRPVAREHCQSSGAASSVVGAGDGGKEPGMAGGWWAGGGSRRPGCMAGTMGTGYVRKTTGAEKARGAEKVLLRLVLSQSQVPLQTALPT